VANHAAASTPTTPVGADGASSAAAGDRHHLVRVLAAGLSLYALYWVVAVVEPLAYRLTFLAVALVLVFLACPATPARRGRTSVPDVGLALLSVLAIGWPLLDLAAFSHRAAEPTPADLAFGVLAVLLVLEATRRTVGWILPVTATVFLLYAVAGPALDRAGLSAIAHRGYGVQRLVGSLYMGLEGLFGVPLDVAATYIVLFAVYGAVLSASGASRFFLDWSLAALGRSTAGAGPARTVALAGFLLGTVSGSGVATTVSLGPVAWPLLQRAGYPRDTAGAILSAAGIGAILSPPTLGAAAFMIAEFLGISYLRVLVMATLPTLLYYLSVLLMIEGHARAVGTRAAPVAAGPVWALTRRRGYHFTSLVAVALLMALGVTAFRAVFWATLLAVALSFLDRGASLGPRRLLAALSEGGMGVLAVTATTATAGIVVGVVTLTGLGLKAAGLVVGLAGGSVFLTVVLSAIAVWILGLAVPVTASYILAAVMVAPAMVQVGVPELAAHMFIFYYAVLSEVSPPTALSPFAAAAITGGRPFRTMMLTWAYTLPAFLVPFSFTLGGRGMGVLLQARPQDVVWTGLACAAGVAALAAALGGWTLSGARPVTRVLAGLGGLALFHPSAAGTAGGAALLAFAWARHRLEGARVPRASRDVPIPGDPASPGDVGSDPGGSNRE